MNINNLPQKPKGVRALNELVFTDIDDSPSNPRLGLGYHQLYDPTKKVGLIAKLPEVTRVGDTIILYWDGLKMQEYELDGPTIEKGWLSFGVSPADIRDPQGEVYYTLYDHESDDLQTSAIRTIVVNRRPPGGLDPDTDTATNERLLPCTVTPNPITSADAVVTVNVVRWTDQELGDELTVLWSNIRVDHPKLTTLGPQTVPIPRDVLEQGGSSEKLLVNYEIRDIVDNYSLLSPPTYVEVDIDPNALIAPRVREANQTTLILDIVALGDKDAHVDIPSYSGNGNAYEVTLSWVGKTPAADIILNLPPERVEDPAFDHAIFIIPNARMKEIAGGSAVVRYGLLQDGDASAKRSKTKTITITGLPVPLAEPVVDEAHGTAVINLVDIIGPEANVSIAVYIGQGAGDKVLFTWKGTPTQGAPVNYTADYEIKTGEELLAVSFRVPRANIDPLGGGKLELSYQVIFKATGNTQNSSVKNYSVSALVAQPVEGFESFEEQDLFTLPLGVALPFNNNLRITVTAAAAQTAIVVPGLSEFGNRVLNCAANNKLKFEFGGTIGKLRLSYALTATALNRLNYFDATGTLVASRNFVPVPLGTVGYEDVVLTSRCTYCELAVDGTGVFIDNLLWE